MILYNVTVNLDKDIHLEWLDWMKEVHIPEVLATGCFLENKIFRLMHETENDGVTYSVQYFLDSMNDYDRYRISHATALQEHHNKRYLGKFVAFRTILESAS